MDLYPDACIILNTRRSPEQWAQSFEETIMPFCSWEYWFAGMLTRLDRLHCRFHTIDIRYWLTHFGLEGNRDWLPELYTLHNQWVREEAQSRGRRVLEWKPEDGWGPICEFLGKSVPDGPFPYENERARLRRVYKERVRKGLRRWALVFGGMVALFVANFAAAWNSHRG
jgi:hypothetical protein